MAPGPDVNAPVLSAPGADGALRSDPQDSWQAILDALPAHIALLDPEGRIRVVNQAWRRFALANAFPAGGCGLGQDYPAVCDDVRGVCAGEARRAGEGIRDVLAGQRSEFTLEYPCHSPLERRWFRMMVAPIHPGEQRGCVVMHINVTDRRLAEDALRANEARLRAILDTEPECVKVVAPDGRLLAMNPAGLAMIEAGGFEQVAGWPLQDLVHPDDWPAYLALHQRVLRGQPGQLQFRITGLKGGARWMDTHSAPMRDAAGRVESVLSVTRDTTDRHATEQAIARLQRRPLHILQAAAEGIHGIDDEGRITFMNPAAERILGWTSGEAAGRDAHALYHSRRADGTTCPDDACPILRTMRDGESRRIDDEVFIHRDGRPIPVEYTVAPKRGEDGKLLGAVVCFRDISERLAAQAALASSEERFRLVARATANAIWDWDLRADTVAWSGRLSALFGFDPEHAPTEPGFWEERIHPEDREQVAASLRQALAGDGDSWQGEYRFRRRDGGYATVEDRGFITRAADGEAVRMVGGMSDVSEVRALEAQLRASQRLEAVGQLTGGIAHDFNNLLTVVLGNAELLGEQLPPDSAQHELASMIRSAAKRGSDLTQRLLAFARRQTLEVRLVELGALVLGMEHLVRRALGEHRLVLRTDPDTWVMADAAQLENAVLNLCINARDAMAHRGELEIAVSRVSVAPPDIDPLGCPEQADYVRLEVRDNGCGIPADLLSRVIEPFFTTKDTGKGTGLGLSMVYGLVKQSSGYMDIRSSPGRGTTVRIHLPAVPAPSGALLGEAAPETAAKGGSEHVLLVEDDALVRRYAASQLEALGYRVDVADDGEQALRLLADEPGIALMLTDVMMPGLNGNQLAEAARRLRPELRVLFSSGYSEDVLAREGRLPAGVLLLAKPYDKTELARRVRQALA